MADDSPLNALADGLAVLDESGVLYALIGGMAMAAWNAGRATVDADVLALAGPSETMQLASAFTARGFTPPIAHTTDTGSGLRTTRASLGFDVLMTKNDVAA